MWGGGRLRGQLVGTGPDRYGAWPSPQSELSFELDDSTTSWSGDECAELVQEIKTIAVAEVLLCILLSVGGPATHHKPLPLVQLL